ncbi:hypothetical protein CBM2592_A20009 [Cupriavidus taiwanensis]|nr:hypothetical protein CBM2588_A10235 [Cupriavidus taiwanensis]SOY48705.1 hypothetical protein CBM2592_A20009 [Cupriavidus taiwanensis]SOY82303.1 hypothetical protein CBM2591_A20009 [Cupriavidus taiwanensis]SOZ56101.1 hypothetical protein CBM2617_A20062 [Cupriavidus taiwanensis]SOZ78968.1 hypothetical protein CBM2618_A20061 [Cupriavidus taiwanensis]
MFECVHGESRGRSLAAGRGLSHSAGTSLIAREGACKHRLPADLVDANVNVNNTGSFPS